MSEAQDLPVNPSTVFNESESPNDPVLIVFAGVNSTAGTTAVLVENIDTLKEKFKKVITIEYSSYKSCQSAACEQRDKLPQECKFNPEQRMNQEIAAKAHEIIQSQNLTNVHLLGKCNGAWVAIELFLLGGGFYKNLYLVVPGIPPIGILKQLEAYPESKLFFGFVDKDGFYFKGWDKKSNEEMPRYIEELANLPNQNLVVKEYKIVGVDVKLADKLYHELHPSMIEDIVNL